MFFILFLLWVAFNGQITLEICLFGVVISAALCLFMRKVMGYSPKTDILIAKRLWKAVKYCLLLIKEIMKACFTVSKIILTGADEIKPELVYFKPDLQRESSQVVLANSITLTPGTITVSVKDGKYCVHALNRPLAQGIESCDFVKKLKEIELDREGDLNRE